MEKIKVPIQTCPHYKGLPYPFYQTEGSVGMDLVAAVEESVTVNPGNTILIPTGIKIQLPSGYEAQIRPRSGLALNYGITVLNSPGTIDSDYRGEIKVILINLGNQVFEIKRGMRIAQIVFAEVSKVEWADYISLEETTRNSGGFGHTGF
ncbi:MAG: dUTP diphosphatase [Bacillota bacterium]|jgi:dUTP pyrophosphatase